jgi:hypothetical protein
MITLRYIFCRVNTIKRHQIEKHCDLKKLLVGHDCMVNGFLQFHTFENMMLKMKLTQIQDGSAINFGATAMGGVVIESETTLLPLSLVLKQTHLPTATYEGSPAEPVG